MPRFNVGDLVVIDNFEPVEGEDYDPYVADDMMTFFRNRTVLVVECTEYEEDWCHCSPRNNEEDDGLDFTYCNSWLRLAKPQKKKQKARQMKRKPYIL